MVARKKYVILGKKVDLKIKTVLRTVITVLYFVEKKRKVVLSKVKE